MSTTPARQPAGVPSGGQFAAKSHPESEVELTAEPDGQAQPVKTVRADGTEEWKLNGALHRDGGPAIVRPDGYEAWFQHGERHRDGGPAVVYPDGRQEWYQYGDFHRDGGPAATQPDGFEMWFQHGERHRDGGPAFTRSDGAQEWYRYGKKVDPPRSALSPSPARLSDDAIRGIVNDKSLSPDERIAKLQEALGDPVDTDVDAPPGIDYSAKAFRQHFEGDNEIEPLLDGLTDDQIHAAADDYLGSAAADRIWEEYHLAGCEIVRQAASDAARTG